MSSKHGAVRAVLFALAANSGIAVSKFAAWGFTGSGSMLAEAIHSSADSLNQVLLLFGIRRATKPPTDEHPMGFGKETFFASFLVGLFLFSLGGLFALYHGWHALREDAPVENPWVALVVLGVGVLLESISLWGALREVRRESPGLSLWKYFKESRSAELITVLGEDVAALLGLSVAAVAVALTMVTGDPVWDAVGSMAVGVILITVSVLLSIEVHALLLGQSAAPSVRADMQRWLSAHPLVDTVFRVITIHHGDLLMVAVKARMRDAATITADEAARRVNHVEVAMHARWSNIGWVFFEQDITDAEDSA